MKDDRLKSSIKLTCLIACRVSMSQSVPLGIGNVYVSYKMNVISQLKGHCRFNNPLKVVVHEAL